MAWLIGIAVLLATSVGGVWVLVEFGHFLDKEDDPKFRAMRASLALWLTSQGEQSFPKRIRVTNELFFHWFDACFQGKGALLEQGLWLGLIFSPVMLLLIRLLLLMAGEQMPQTSRMLLFAMTLAFGLSTAVVAGRALGAMAGRLGVVLYVVLGVVLGGVVWGVLGGVLYVVLGGVLGVVVWGVLGVVVWGVLGGVLWGVLSVLLFGVFGVAFFNEGLTFGLSFATGSVLGGVALQLMKIRLPVHPWRSLALSLATVFVLGAIMRGATTSF